MPLPSTVDLRAAVERTSSHRVSDQGRTNACGGYATAAAIECLLELAGRPYRPVSAPWIYQRALQFDGRLGEDCGSGQETLAKVLANGFVYADQADAAGGYLPATLDEAARANAGGGPVRVSTGWLPGADAVAALRRSLAMGLPVVICIPVGEALWAGIQGPDWRTHNPTAGDERNTHWCAAVGYDDNAGRILVEDSSGPAAWDGGFFGLPYALVRQGGYIKAAWRVEHIPSVPIHIADIGEPADQIITKMDLGRWFDAARQALPADVRAAYLAANPLNFYSLAAQGWAAVRPALLSAAVVELQNNGVPGLLAWCRTMRVTDLLLEVLAGWPRGAVRRYFDDQALAADLVEWAPL